MKLNLKKTVLIFIAGIILGMSVLPVYAISTSDSPWAYYGPQLGFEYMNRSRITYWEDPYNDIDTSATVQTRWGDDAPMGYMGVISWTYKDDAIIDMSDWVYNQSATWYVWAYSPTYYSDPGEYKGDGQSRAYNAQGEYYTYAMYSTPIVVLD